MITVDFRRLSIEPGYRILDIGCGSGRHMGETVRFEETVSIGTDINEGDLDEARKRIAFLYEIGEVRGKWGVGAADITALPFEDESFDLVICSEVLEHIPDDRKALSEAVRVLKNGKQIVVSVPRTVPEKLCWNLSENYHNTPGGHIRIYDKNGMLRLLKQSGVRPHAFHHAHALHTPFWWLKCFVGPGRNDSLPVNLYHRLLVWDMMVKPRLTRCIERILNPVIGKSMVFYAEKGELGENIKPGKRALQKTAMPLPGLIMLDN